MKRARTTRQFKDLFELLNITADRLHDAAYQEEISAQVEEAAIMYEEALRMYTNCVKRLAEARARTQAVSRAFAKLAEPRTGIEPHDPPLGNDGDVT